MGGQRPPGREIDLERAHETFAVARHDARARAGIHALQQCVQALDAALVGDPVEAGAQLLVRTGPGKQPTRQRAIVEPRAPHENRQPVARMNVPNGRRRVARELRRGVHLGRVRDVDQMVRDAAPIFLRHLVGADVEAAVDRRRIAIDDLAVVAFGQREAEGALPRRGGAEHGQNDRTHPTILTIVHFRRRASCGFRLEPKPEDQRGPPTA